jgi:recombination DNA repair RAD52 pathway protein
LVAENFLEQPSPEHTLVAHLDYNKKNNHVNNLIWMTRKENTEHQKKSPYVIAEKKSRVNKRNENTKVYKLTSTKVMLIKKRINEGVPLRTLAKTFKVTETQLLRIKRGINWGNVNPAS